MTSDCTNSSAASTEVSGLSGLVILSLLASCHFMCLKILGEQRGVKPAEARG